MSVQKPINSDVRFVPSLLRTSGPISNRTHLIRNSAASKENRNKRKNGQLSRLINIFVGNRKQNVNSDEKTINKIQFT